jgi:hypothetical protein
MSDPALKEGLVPGRSCGTCTVCCYALPIDTPELNKLPGVVCRNCTGRGCAIYDARPTVCQGFYCGWRMLPQLDEEWRPDRSGVLVTPQNENIPAEFELREGIEFLIIGGEDAIRRPGFVETICTFVRRRVATFVAIPGPEGYFPARVILNTDQMVDAAAKGDRARALSLLLSLLEQAKDHEFQPAVLVHGPSR